MSKYIKYLKYVIRHKFFVLVECWKRGLYWRGLTHDLSKLRPSEFFPYVSYFYGYKDDIKKGRDSTEHYKLTDTVNKNFDFAWLLHQKRNRHHWQWWVLPEDDGDTKVLEMEENDRTEMLCDWIGAGKAQGYFSPKEDPLQETRKWWNKNNHKMQLHKNTRKYFVDLLSE